MASRGRGFGQRKPKRFNRNLSERKRSSFSEAQKKDRERQNREEGKRPPPISRKKYFGPEGELYKKRTALLQPIQDEVYNAVKTVAQAKGFQLILDRASEGAGIIFASPAIDISNEVLAKLGYSN